MTAYRARMDKALLRLGLINHAMLCGVERKTAVRLVDDALTSDSTDVDALMEQVAEAAMRDLWPNYT